MGCAGQINPQRGWKRSYGARRTSRLYLRSSARRRPLLLPRHPPQFNPPQFNPPLLRLCSPIQPKLPPSARGRVSQQKQEKQRLRQQQLAERQRQQQLAEQQRQEQKKAEQRKALQAQQQAQQQA